MKKVFLAVLLVLVASQMVFAAKVTYKWKYAGTEPIDFYEVRLNGGDWQVVSAQEKKISFDLSDEQAAALTDTSFEIRSAIGDRRSEIITIPSPVKAKKTAVTYRWKYAGTEPIDFYEVRLNGGDWQIVSADKGSISFKLSDEQVAALTDTSFEIRSAIGDRRSEIITIPSPVKAKKTAVASESKYTVSLAGNPYALQSFVMDNEEMNNLVKSKYGTGGRIGYDMKLGKVFRVGADIECQTFFLENTGNFTDLSILAKLGYDAYLTNAIRFFTNVKGGIDLQFFENIVPSVVVEFGPEIGVAVNFGKHLNCFASCEGLFGFPKGENVDFVEFRVSPAIGMGFSF